MLGKYDMICKNHLLLNPLQCQGLLGRDCKQDEKLERLYVMDWMGESSSSLKIIEVLHLTCGKIWIIKTSIKKMKMTSSWTNLSLKPWEKAQKNDSRSQLLSVATAPSWMHRTVLGFKKQSEWVSFLIYTPKTYLQGTYVRFPTFCSPETLQSVA